jgi:hypothetical protein
MTLDPILVDVLEDGGCTVAFFDSEDEASAFPDGIDAFPVCLDGGFAGWAPEHASMFQRTDVVIVAQRNDGSRQAASTIVRSLAGVARSVRCVEPAEGLDFFGHLAAGRSWDDLVVVDTGWAAAAGTAAVGLARIRANHLAGDAIRSVPSRRALVPGWLDLDSLAVLYAPSDSYKSFLAIDVALHVATGTPWNGLHVHAGDVLYVVGEGIAGIPNRLDAWLAEHGRHDAPERMHWYRGAVNLLDPREASDFLHLAADIRPALVIIDTLATCMPGGDENGSRDMGQVVDRARRLKAETGACVLIVHHTGRDETRGARGWSGLKNALDSELEMRKSGYLAATLTSRKQKDGAHPDPLPLALVEHTWPCPHCTDGCDLCRHQGHAGSLAITHTVPGATVSDDPLVVHLQNTPDGVTARQAARALYGDTDRKYIARATRQLDALVDAGHATKTPGTKGGADGGTPTTYTLRTHPHSEDR